MLETPARRGRLPSIALLAAAAVCGGCASQGAIGVLGPGVVNDPENRSLRFDLLKFGLESFCEEMKGAGVPLKLRDDEPVLGRFHATACNSQVMDEETRKSFVVQYAGTGFATSPQGGRIGFSTTGLVEYSPDFLMHEGALYVYFRPRVVDATGFQTLLVESELAKTALGLFGVSPDAFGRRVVEGQLRRGLTVIRYDSSGETEFASGVIEKGQRPYHPFAVRSSDKRVLLNERTEVHVAQQDFIGPLSVADDEALYLTAEVDGAEAVDVLVLRELEGQALRDAYVKKPGPATANVTPLLAERVPRGELWKRHVPVPPGRYYLVLDNSAALGIAEPSAGSARVDVLALGGDRP